MLGEQKGAVRSEMVSERKDLSYVAVFAKNVNLEEFVSRALLLSSQC